MRTRGVKRQKNQLELAFDPVWKGEALTTGSQGTEPQRTARDGRGPAETDRLTSRTAVYGPVRTVVWEGREPRGSPPIPISPGSERRRRGDPG
jgi:hypothetical protein